VFERTFQSRKPYNDPFNDVDVDVIVRGGGGRTWRVPAFWRGGQRWTVRFAPPAPGTYAYRLESTDRSNADLHGQSGQFEVTPYTGTSVLLQRGALQISDNKRYFEHADGTPFYWLGDTWWTGLSDRLSWDGFKRLTADRKAKGFTLVQLVAGLVPLEEPPSEPGFCNEGGCVWGSDFKRINPKYFDYADRRIEWLVNNDIVPAIVGGWTSVLPRMGIDKMKKHWRYIIARYGAYPVVWIVGGEVMDPPDGIADRVPVPLRSMVVRGWTEVTKYVRKADPYRHPLTVHELPPPLDYPVEDESLMDFDLLQSGQFGWPSIAFSVMQLNSHHARESVTKPVVQGEIGYENHYYRHFEDYQRTAFWLSMLNGAAGHTYGADATWGAYSADKPLPGRLLSFLNWEEGMNLPGSYQVGLGAKLLRKYEWWRFQPHPDWVSPRGTTYFDKKNSAATQDWMSWWLDDRSEQGFFRYPLEEETRRLGSLDRPYAAGIPGQVRIVYIPTRRDSAMSEEPPPTVLGFEPGICYFAYLWEPQMGIRIDLGGVQRFSDQGWRVHEQFESAGLKPDWVGSPGFGVVSGKLRADAPGLVTLKNVKETDVVVEVEAQPNADASVVARYQDNDNYVAAIYSARDQVVYLAERRKGVEGRALGETSIPLLEGEIRLSMEVQKSVGVASITDGHHTYTTPIVQLEGPAAGSVGVSYLAQQRGIAQSFDEFKMQRSASKVQHAHLPTKLYDASGGYRGDLAASERWASFREEQYILLDAYRPQKLPTPGDWILVLDATSSAKGACAVELTSHARLH
jgi:hypothetical protein